MADNEKKPKVLFYVKEQSDGSDKMLSWVSVDKEIIRNLRLENQIPASAKMASDRVFLKRRSYEKIIATAIEKNGVEALYSRRLARNLKRQQENNPEKANQDIQSEMNFSGSNDDLSIVFARKKIADEKALVNFIDSVAHTYNAHEVRSDVKHGSIVLDEESKKGRIGLVRVKDQDTGRRFERYSITYENGLSKQLPEIDPFNKMVVVNTPFVTKLNDMSMAGILRANQKYNASQNPDEVTSKTAIKPAFHVALKDSAEGAIFNDHYKTQWLAIKHAAVNNLGLKDSLDSSARITQNTVYIDVDTDNYERWEKALKANELSPEVREVTMHSSHEHGLKRSFEYHQYFLHKKFQDLDVSFEGVDGRINLPKLSQIETSPEFISGKDNSTETGRVTSRYFEITSKVEPPSFHDKVASTCQCCKQRESTATIEIDKSKIDVCDDKKCLEQTNEMVKEQTKRPDNQQDIESTQPSRVQAANKEKQRSLSLDNYPS